jgi:ABC-type glycerol-3-phosphate transport system permease component
MNGGTVKLLRRNDLLSLLIFIGSRRGSASITVKMANLVQSAGRTRTCSSAARCPAVVPTAVFALPQRFFVRGVLAGAVAGWTQPAHYCSGISIADGRYD